MAKSLSQNVCIDFQCDLADLEVVTGWDDATLAKHLNCCEKTISNMRQDPFSVSAKYILLVQGLLQRENSKRAAAIMRGSRVQQHA